MHCGEDATMTTTNTPGTISNEEMLRVGIKAVVNIAAAWQLKDDELGTLLGGRSARTIRRWRAAMLAGEWKQQPLEDKELRVRLSLIVGIYKSLHLLHDDPAHADDWIQRPHSLPPLDGLLALTTMLEGGLEAMWQVRRYLEAEASR